MGLCGGYGLKCIAAEYRIDVAGPWVRVGAPAILIPIGSGVYVKSDAQPTRHRELDS